MYSSEVQIADEVLKSQKACYAAMLAASVEHHNALTRETMLCCSRSPKTFNMLYCLILGSAKILDRSIIYILYRSHNKETQTSVPGPSH